jgi:hypothetical protein
MMKEMLDILETFTESEWKRAKKEMTKRIPSMKIDKMSMEEFKLLTKFLAGPNYEDINKSKRIH